MSEQRVTFCRICEAACGLVATVDDGVVTKLRPDAEHPLSQGYACPKGIAMVEIQNDPDRVLHPLRRRKDGEFERVSWDEALADIGTRLRDLVEEHGGDCVGWYAGNPSAFSYSHTLWVKGFLDALDTPHYYTAGSQDVNNRFAASALLYGSPVVIPIPDIERTDLLLMIGANPLVSHGSLLSMPRIKDKLGEIKRRGGRVVVVDPRRTETARAFEHLPIVPDGDAHLLLSMLQVVFEEGLAERGWLDANVEGAESLAQLVREHTPEVTAVRTGIAPETVRALARDFARATGAAAYGRTGSCLGRFGTLTAFLIDALNAVTGHLDTAGGAVFSDPPIAIDEVADRFGLATYDRRRSRVGGFPDVLGSMPATMMAPEIETPGPGRLRALFVSAGNPVLSVPDGEALERALPKLDLHVSLDLYVTETNRHADYVLPATTFLEREDVPLALQPFFIKPFIQYTPAVVEPAGEARQEWEVVDVIARAIGVTPSSVSAARALGRLGVRLSPERTLDLLVRTGPGGDLFGAKRGGLSLGKLKRHPHGIKLADELPTGTLRKKLRNESKRVQLAPSQIVDEIARLAEQAPADERFPLRLIGLRELRSHNSWMHNSPKLMAAGRRHALRINPDDAAARGIEDGSMVNVRSGQGELEVEARVTDEMTPGTVALPHGWGHRGGWRLANASGGANVNALASAQPGDLERLAGMSVLNGIPVEVLAAPSERSAEPAGAAAAP